MVSACKANVWLEKRGLWSPRVGGERGSSDCEQRGASAVLALFPDQGAGCMRGHPYAFPQGLC